LIGHYDVAYVMPKHVEPTSIASPEEAKSFAQNGSPMVLNVTSDTTNLATVRVACEAYAAATGLDERAVGEVGLCVNEAMANVTRHAYDGAIDRPVRVTARKTDLGDGVRIELRDWGKGVNPADRRPPPHDPLKPGGLGLVCLRELMDDAEFIPQPDGMMLILVKRVRRS
jgi:anti-sigma regulatory factor (Ser/Thr protein kinase)